MHQQIKYINHSAQLTGNQKLQLLPDMWLGKEGRQPQCEGQKKRDGP